MVKAKSQSKLISNRRARYDYNVKETYLVGVQLSGRETRALRLGHGSLQGAYVTINNNELWLLNAAITGSAGAQISDSEQTRSRKLLAKRNEIEELARLKKQGATIVPLEIQTKGRYIKLKIAAGVGKKSYDKRATIKARDESRRIQGYLKH